MIEKIESINQLEGWTKRDIFSVRILSLLNSYGTKYQFCTFYRQITDGKITALLSRLDGNFTLSLESGFDGEELVHFFCVTGYTSILTSDEFELSDRFEQGAVMLCTSKRDIALPAGCELDEYPKLMDLYNFIDYNEQDFKAWYVDISHRVRHGTAKAYALKLDGEIISSGVLSSICDGLAILTAVRTGDSFRKMGYGSALVSAICADVSKGVYIMRDENLNESFYKKLGFENIGKWRMFR